MLLREERRRAQRLHGVAARGDGRSDHGRACGQVGLDRAIFSNAEMSGLDVVAERLDAVDLGAFRRRQQQEWRQLTPLGAPRRRVSRF